MTTGDRSRVLQSFAAAALFSACGPSQDDMQARIDALETKLQALEGQTQPVSSTLPFEIACPAPWTALGPVGDALWACRAQQPQSDGFWPNCNVTEGAVERDTQAREVFAATLQAVPQLRSARRIAERPSALDTQPAHEALYEHDLAAKPLRVLATLAVRSDHLYAVSCAAPPSTFTGHEATFRQITQSLRWKP